MTAEYIRPRDLRRRSAGRARCGRGKACRDCGQVAREGRERCSLCEPIYERRQRARQLATGGQP